MISWKGSSVADYADDYNKRILKGFAILVRNEDGSLTQYKGLSQHQNPFTLPTVIVRGG